MKGVDAALWAVCRGLGLRIRALPVYSPELEHVSDDDDSGDDDENDEEASRWDPLSLFGETSGSRAHLNESDGGPDWIGDGFDPVQSGDFGNYEQNLGRRMRDAYFASKYRGIYWLNGPGHSEPSVAYVHVRTSSE